MLLVSGARESKHILRFLTGKLAASIGIEEFNGDTEMGLDHSNEVGDLRRNVSLLLDESDPHVSCFLVEEW